MVLSGPDDGGNDNPHGRTQSPGDCPGFQSRRRHPRRAGPPAGSLPGMDRRRLPRRDGLSGAARPCGPPPRPGGHPARRALAGRRGSRLRHRATAGGSHRRPQPRPLLQLRLGRGLPRRDDAAVGGVGRVAGEGSAGEQGGRGAGETASSCRRGRYTPSPSGRGMGRGPATPLALRERVGERVFAAASTSTPAPCWSATTARRPGWALSARTLCSSTRGAARGSFWGCC
jgi:hypothetical protein